MMSRIICLLGCAGVAAVVWVGLASAASADSFGTGPNQFDIEFVTISGATNPASGSGVVEYNFRIGVYEVTNDQWNKFKVELGIPITGEPAGAYGRNSYWSGTNVPANSVSWYGAAQFVNWLNTSTGHQAAYRFTGTPGTGDHILATWSAAEAAGGTNLYRHKDAFYFLPTEDEWVKAAYWNGTSLQTYATPADTPPAAGVDANYNLALGQPWDVGSGRKEVNGTFDMMGNVWEWMESPYHGDADEIGLARALRGGSYNRRDALFLSSWYRTDYAPHDVLDSLGFRVASIPEPASLSLFLLFGPGLIARRRMAPGTGCGKPHPL